MRPGSKMYYECVVLYLCSLYVSHTTGEPSDPCTEQINTCTCKTKKGYINLDPLDTAKLTGTPKFSGVADTFFNTYSYNPCTGFLFESTQGVAIGQVAEYYSFTIAVQDGATFTSAETGTKLVYNYNSMTSTVLLTCEPDIEGTFSANSGTGSPSNVNFLQPQGYLVRCKSFCDAGRLVYMQDFTLKTKYACSDIAPPPPGYSRATLSPGDVLLIVFFVCLGVYFIGGVLFNRFYKHSAGLEIIPNVEFWKALPGLAKDGVVFVWGSITGLVSGSSTKQSTYDSI